MKLEIKPSNEHLEFQAEIKAFIMDRLQKYIGEVNTPQTRAMIAQEIDRIKSEIIRGLENEVGS